MFNLEFFCRGATPHFRTVEAQNILNFVKTPLFTRMAFMLAARGTRTLRQPLCALPHRAPSSQARFNRNSPRHTQTVGVQLCTFQHPLKICSPVGVVSVLRSRFSRFSTCWCCSSVPKRGYGRAATRIVPRAPVTLYLCRCQYLLTPEWTPFSICVTFQLFCERYPRHG